METRSATDRAAPAPAPRLRRLGRQPYGPVFEAMRAYTEARDEGSADELWLVEHEPVFTLGLNGRPEHLLAPGEIPVQQVDRGGQVTYHGPGQIVLYTLLDLRRLGLGVRALVSALERSVIRLLADYGIEAVARPDAPGVYVAGRKIAALGLRVRRGRCYHGLSLNHDMDLSPFARINPCGHAGLEVTSLARLGVGATQEEISRALCGHLCDELGYTGCPETLPAIEPLPRTTT